MAIAPLVSALLARHDGAWAHVVRPYGKKHTVTARRIKNALTLP